MKKTRPILTRAGFGICLLLTHASALPVTSIAGSQACSQAVFKESPSKLSTPNDGLNRFKHSKRVLFLTFTSASVRQQEGSRQRKVPTVAFCDLVSNPDLYDGKEIRFRATFVSAPMRLASDFYDSKCRDDDNTLTWAEFDESSVKASSKPEVVKKLEEILLPETNLVTSETEFVVIGVFHKPNGSGYGRERKYRFMVTVKTVEDILDTKRR